MHILTKMNLTTYIYHETCFNHVNTTTTLGNMVEKRKKGSVVKIKSVTKEGNGRLRGWRSEGRGASMPSYPKASL